MASSQATPGSGRLSAQPQTSPAFSLGQFPSPSPQQQQGTNTVASNGAAGAGRLPSPQSSPLASPAVVGGTAVPTPSPSSQQQPPQQQQPQLGKGKFGNHTPTTVPSLPRPPPPSQSNSYSSQMAAITASLNRVFIKPKQYS